MPYGLRQGVFGVLNLVLVAPGAYMVLGLPLVMRQHGWSGTDIGLFQLAGLPAVLKFLLAIPVERYRFGRAHYKAWAMVCCLAYAGVLLAIGHQGLMAGKGPLFVMALAAGLMATWADIPVNALAMKMLPEAERMRAGGLRSAAMFLGAIIGGGLMLLVQEHWGWQAPFLVMTLPMLLGVGVLALLQEPAVEARPAIASTGLRQRRALSGYFRQPAADAWTVLLLLYFPLVGAAWVYLKPLLLDHGFAASDVAWLAGVGGSAVGALTSLGVARLVKAIGVARALPLFAGFNLMTLAALTLMAWIGAGHAFFVVGTALLASAMGATAALVFGLMMYFARSQFQAADYGTQASIFTLSRLLVLPVVGVLLDRFGYAGMLSGLTVAMLGVLIVVMRQREIIAIAMHSRRASEAGDGRGRLPTTAADPQTLARQASGS